jgi:hypothetical protein
MPGPGIPLSIIPRIIAGISLDDESGDFARMLADLGGRRHHHKEQSRRRLVRRTLDSTLRRVHHSGKPGC